MIDRKARNEASALLRQMMSGRIEIWDFLGWAETVETDDRGVQAAAEFGAQFDDDLGPDRLGRRNTPRSTRRQAARIILFLRSDREYEWPPFPYCGPMDALKGFGSVLACLGSAFAMLVAGINAILLSIVGRGALTLFRLSRESRRRRLAWEATGDYFVWPYFRHEDLCDDKRLPSSRSHS